MNSNEIVKTKLSSVACMGNEAPYDHPKIYLEIDPEIGEISCPYCSKVFVAEN